MKPERMGAFSDGVFAVIITIVVLELPVPHVGTLAALGTVAPVLAAYALSFLNIGLYWNNHHHMLQATTRIDGSVLWANHLMLFWLSLTPWVIRWADESAFAAMAVAAYGFVLGMAALGYSLTQARIIRVEGPDSRVARAIGHDWKGRGSLVGYFLATPLAFVARPVAVAIYLAIALLWFVPDRRIERTLGDR